MNRKSLHPIKLALGGLLGLAFGVLIYIFNLAQIEMHCYNKNQTDAYCTITETRPFNTRKEHILTKNISNIDIVSRESGKGYRDFFEIKMKNGNIVKINSVAFNTLDLHTNKKLLQEFLDNKTSEYHMNLNNENNTLLIIALSCVITVIILVSAIIWKFIKR